MVLIYAFDPSQFCNRFHTQRSLITGGKVEVIITVKMESARDN